MPRASELAGVGIRRMIIAVYVWCGLCAALAGVIAAADIMGADANNAGLWLELDAILAVVIGGTSLFGGRFSLVLAVCGALIIQAMNTGILLVGLSAGVQSGGQGRGGDGGAAAAVAAAVAASPRRYGKADGHERGCLRFAITALVFRGRLCGLRRCSFPISPRPASSPICSPTTPSSASSRSA